MNRIISCFFIFCLYFQGFTQNNILHLKNSVAEIMEKTNHPLRTVEEKENYIEVEYNFNNIDVYNIERNDKLLQLIKIKGFSLMDNVGKPALPCYNDIFVVPQKEEIQIKIVESRFEEFDNYYIHPAIEPQLDNIQIDSIFQLNFDSNTYASSTFYPSSIVEIISIQDYREIPIAFIQIRPIQFNPESRKIRCYSKIKYHIICPSDNKKNINFIGNESLNVIKNTQSNAFVTDSKYLQSVIKTGSLSSSSDRNYIIITTTEFLDAANEFADWKTLLGHSCEVVSQASWTSNQVKNAINTRYSNWNPKPEFFLIIGDHEDVPGEVFTSTYGDYASDLYYACMGGTGDYTPDMAHGRISVSNLEEAYVVLRKIMNYELNPTSSSEFYENGLHCAMFEDDSTDSDEDGINDTPPDGYADKRFTHTSEEIRDYLLNKGYTINRVYATTDIVTPRFYNNGFYSDGQAIPSELRKDIYSFYPWTGNSSQINSELNSGRFFMLHRGHGDYYQFGFPFYSINDVNNLNNGNKLPVMFNIHCQSGGFIQSVCLAEKLIRRTNGGAVGVFAASQASYSGRNDALAVGMFDAIWSNPGLIPDFGSGGISNPTVNNHADIFKMGNVLNQGLLRMGQTWGLSEYTNRVFHYFGDPSMEMYTAYPSTFTNVSVNKNGSSVTVNTNVSNCKITICSIFDMGGTLYEVVDSVSSHTFSDVTTSYYICVTKHNYKPFIYPDDIYIQNYTFTDDRLIIGKNIYVGSNVTPTISQGPVNIQDGANIIFRAKENILFDKDVEVEVGSTIEVQPL